MRKSMLLLLFLPFLVCCGEDEGVVKITYLEAQTYSDSILRSRERLVSVVKGPTVLLRQSLLTETRENPEVIALADLGGRPVAGIWVEWAGVPDAENYSVYSGTELSGLALVTNLSATNRSYYIVVTNPVFSMNYGVRVEATKAGYYPKTSEIKWIPLLGQYTLSLTAPADYTNVTTLKPVFAWAADAISGSTGRLDYFRIRQVSGTFEYVMTQPLRDISSYGYNGAALVRNTLYEWDIYKSITYKLHNAAGTVVSVSLPRKLNAEGEAGSNNGRWYFTILD